MSPEEAFTRKPNIGYGEGVIYLITNAITGKKYVGQSINCIEERWEGHLEEASRKVKKQRGSLHEAIRQYGKDAFEITKIDSGTAHDGELTEKEKYWIRELNTLQPNGYNILSSGVSGGSNKKPTEINEVKFQSKKEAVQYVAKKYDISYAAAEKRISSRRIDVKNQQNQVKA